MSLVSWPRSWRQWVFLVTGFSLTAGVFYYQFSRLVQRAENQKEAVEWIYERGGEAIYDYQICDDRSIDKARHSRIPKFLLSRFGVDFFHSIHFVSLDQVDRRPNTEYFLNRLPGLQAVELVSVDESEANAFPNLSKLPNLKRISTNMRVPIYNLRSSVQLEALSGIGDTHISRLENLRKLKLIFPESVSPIQHLPNIEFLELDSLQSSKKGDIEQLSKVKKLVVSDGNVSEWTELQKLDRLRSLEFHNVASEELVRLKFPPNLQSIKLSNTSFKGEIFRRPFEKLKNLEMKFISIGRNCFQDSEFPVLEHFDLDSQESLEYFGIKKQAFPSLKNLSLGEVTTEDRLLSDYFLKVKTLSVRVLDFPAFQRNLSYFDDLEHFWCRIEEAYDWDFGELKKLKALKSLHLQAINLSELDLKVDLEDQTADSLRRQAKDLADSISKLDQLQWLSIPAFPIDGFVEIGKLKELKGLNVSGSQTQLKIKEEDRRALAGLRNLEQLLLCKTSTMDFSFMKDLQSLKTLSLNMEPIDDLSTLPKLDNLEYLCLNNMELKSLDGIEKLPRLTTLVLNNCRIEDPTDLGKTKRMREVITLKRTLLGFPFGVNVGDYQISRVTGSFSIDSDIYFLDNPNFPNQWLPESERIDSDRESWLPGPDYIKHRRDTQWK